MREAKGTLKSLLSKTNKTQSNNKKQRVVFDETKNEFFEADYIILIREDCPFNEDDDDEPCTCGEHELVKICCDNFCNCNYFDEHKTPPVSFS